MIQSDMEAFREHLAADPGENDTALLYKAIDQLNPLEKSIVILYLEEQSYVEIADITGLTVNHIGVRLNRIKSKIKKILLSYGVR